MSRENTPPDGDTVSFEIDAPHLAHHTAWKLPGDRVWFAFHTPFLRQFVDNLKSRIDPAYRQWRADAKLWLVDMDKIDVAMGVFLLCYRGNEVCRQCPTDCAVIRGLSLRTRPMGIGWAVDASVAAPACSYEEARAADLLGVSLAATAEEVKTAARRLAKLIHPDVGGTAGLMRQVLEARDLLLAKRR